MSSFAAYAEVNAAPVSKNFKSVGMADRVPPQNIDAERAVLAAMMLDSDVCDDALTKLKKRDFYRPAHQKIFEAMEDLAARGTAVDQLSLADRLAARGELEQIGGKPYIVELANNAFALVNWENHADIIHRNAMLRELIGASTRITALAFDAPDDLDEVVEQSEKLLYNVTNKQVSNDFKAMDSLVMETYEMMQEQANNKGKLMGVPTGFIALDRMFAGLRGGDLIILAARPGIGKTAFALNIATRAAKAGTHVAIFSLEMPAEQLVQRIMCAEARVGLEGLRNGNASTQDWTSLIRVSSQLSKLPIAIDDSASTTILELRSKARRELSGLKEGERGLIIVDYLQLMSPQRANTESRQVEIAEISRGLKVLAKELNVPIIALSQLSRAVEARKGKRPVLSDLRESGSIEQDADIVMFLDRSADEREAEENDRPPLGIAEVIVAKHRNGAPGTVQLAFIPQCTLFDNLSRQDG